MIDLVCRAVLHPIDYAAMCERETLTLLDVTEEYEHVFTYTLKPSRPLHWKAGQHGVFTIPGAKIEGQSWRAFSVASSPHEGVVRISTIIGGNPSSYKKVLQNLKRGAKLTMRGPFGEFHVRDGMKHIVGIAGGIGITPFRAILHEIESGLEERVSLTLIYGSKAGLYPFHRDCLRFEKHPKIDIRYVHTPGEVQAVLKHEIKERGNEAHYFISGAPKMIEALRTSLKEQGIKRFHIVNDPFKGY